MTSNIIANTIDETFPVAGVDNDSQGFRDNFNIIKAGLAEAKNEITELQTDSATLSADNDFNGNNIIDANLSSVTLESNSVYATGTSPETTITCFWSEGYTHVIKVGSELTTIILDNWPTDKYGHMKLVLFGTTGNTTDITLSVPSGIVKRSNFPVGDFALDDTTNPVVLDIFTVDGGSNVYIDYVGKFE